MHPALLKLLRLRIVGWCRRFATRGSVLRRVIGGLFVAYLLLSWIGSVVVMVLVDRKPQADPALVVQVGPLVLGLLVALRLATVFTSRAMEFSPAEMEFLFPAPFTRRQLLVYKLGMGSLGGLFLSLVLAGNLMRFGASWLSAVLALGLAILFMQLAGVLAVLARQRLGKGAYGRITLALGAVVLLAGALAAFPSIREAGSIELGAVVRSVAARAHDSTLARVALWPFEVFVRVLVSPPGPALAAWAGVAVAMLGVLLLGIFKLDSLYAEASVAASARSAARFDRARRSGSGFVARSAAIRVPRLPRLGGAGPLAWRQLVTAVRTWHSVAILFAILAAVLVGSRWLAGDEAGGGSALFPILIPLYFVFSASVRFDFRGDIDHIESLKALPLRPWVVAAGQLATPVLITAAMVVFVGLFALFDLPAHASRASAWILLACVLCSLPLALIICSVENVVFLLFPIRVVTGAAADTNSMLRHIATALLKMLLLAIAGGLLAGVGAVAWSASASRATTLGAVWLAACLLGVAGISIVASSFRRFDPSRHMPA